MTKTPPDVPISPTRKMFLSGASVIWIIPILALIVALFVAYRSYSERGPVIVVEFEEGAGISAGETELRFRDVTVGVVEKVGFTSDLDRVTAHIRLDKDVAPYIDNGQCQPIFEVSKYTKRKKMKMCIIETVKMKM